MNSEEFGQMMANMYEQTVGKEEKAASGVMTAQNLHGIGGLFAAQGADPTVFHTYVRPQSIARSLPLYPSVDEDPTYETLTGFTNPDGSQPTNACGDAPTGFEKACRLMARFGLKRFDTQEIEMDKVMLRLNRGDFKDLRLVNDVLGMTGLAPSNVSQEDALNVITKMEMLKAVAYMENALTVDMWQGTVAAGSFPGLMYQIATGQVDADTNTACPSLDSDIKDFTYEDVCGTTKDIVEYLSMLMYYLESLATDTGMQPVSWIIAMRPQLWYELSACWPCKYMTDRCKTANVGYNALTISDGGNVNERDRLRNSMTIPINGVNYPVVVDTGIPEYTNTDNANIPSGEFASNIYAIPVSVTGGIPTTYREYVDYRQAAPDEALLRGKYNWFHTDNGMFSWTYDDERWCYQLGLKTEQRVVLRTPQLAGSVQNVRYSPLQHLREPEFSSPYHIDGGVSLRTAGTRYAVWAAGGIRGQ